MKTYLEMDLISIIMPAYNAEKYIKKSIESVLMQSYSNWELIVVNDGSSDSTEQVVRSFQDSRIKYIEQQNAGVANARNNGLSLMKGEYFCFLDADDLLTFDGIRSRLEVFRSNPKLAFVGGGQLQCNDDLTKKLKVQYPTYQGLPKKGLVRISESCFINCGTWLIKKNSTRKYHFLEGWTHCEDLAFFLSIAEDGELGCTEEIVQVYRRSTNSAMNNLDGLAEGYRSYYNYVKTFSGIKKRDLAYLSYRIRRIMFLSYLRERSFASAFKFAIRF